MSDTMTLAPSRRPADGGRPAEQPTTVDLRLEAMRWVADDVVTAELVSLEAAPLPAWEPGDCIEVALPSGRWGRYPLCGDPWDRSRYRIAVQRSGGPGISELYDATLIGRAVRVRAVPEHCSLEPALSYLFLADGIGVASVLAMVARAAEQRVPWRVVYTGRTLDEMAFVDELCSLPGGRVELCPEDECGPLDLTTALSRVDASTEVYVCESPALVAAVSGSPFAPPTARVHVVRA